MGISLGWKGKLACCADRGLATLTQQQYKLRNLAQSLVKGRWTPGCTSVLTQFTL